MHMDQFPDCAVWSTKTLAQHSSGTIASSTNKLTSIASSVPPRVRSPCACQLDHEQCSPRTMLSGR